HETYYPTKNTEQIQSIKNTIKNSSGRGEIHQSNPRRGEYPMIIIFGSTGDLTRRKLIPALYHLYEEARLTGTRGVVKDAMPIICVGRKKLTTEEYLPLLGTETFIGKNKKHKEHKNDVLAEFLNRISYCFVDFSSTTSETLSECTEKLFRKYGAQKTLIFYLALPSSLFKQSVDIIKASGILDKAEESRIAFEKPFGHDLVSAQELNHHITSVFHEKNIYRIDHYLGKEIVQNILVLRFANPVFEQIWNNQFIDHIQITMAEDMGVETRGSYYDAAGAVRDVVQNHFLQMLSLIAMEPPRSILPDDIKDEKVKVLKALRTLAPEDIVLGQYKAGTLNRKQVPSYREEKEVSPHSMTETYAALRLHIDNERWQDVPFYVRAGKRLCRRYSEINIVLRDITCRFFCTKEFYYSPNIITLRVQPDEGIAFTFNAKLPGSEIRIHPEVMEFCHACKFGENTPEAYETLFYQMLQGDTTLFTRWDEIEESWRFVEPALAARSVQAKDFPNYAAGSFGPKAADELIARDSKAWILPKEMRE
ncbi:glucose-6-phosphate dehydrogenase, partial [Candidatus Woesearchaeota archaeon CG_4_10_14_0_8_um_filter_47_5]